MKACSLNRETAAPDISTPASQPERLFSGQIATEYQMLDLICPAAAEMSRRVGDFVANLPSDPAKRAGALSAFEIGCGTGRTTWRCLSRGRI
jgi:hypothetical protein